jgi:adenylate cyclase class IV
VWQLQKRRREYRHAGRPVVVCLDELPSLGEFVELEGELPDIEAVRRALGSHIGPAERLNYRDLAVRWMADRGLDANALAFPGL